MQVLGKTLLKMGNVLSKVPVSAFKLMRIFQRLGYPWERGSLLTILGFVMSVASEVGISQVFE